MYVTAAASNARDMSPPPAADHNGNAREEGEAAVGLPSPSDEEEKHFLALCVQPWEEVTTGANTQEEEYFLNLCMEILAGRRY